MNITREDIGNLNAVLKVELTPEDYQSKVEKTLKEHQRKANLPGFRPGKVPFGVVKKMYGGSITAEELNKTVSESLNAYILENKLELLGSPMAMVDEPLDIDITNPKDVTFKFEIGIQPEINVAINNELAVDYLTITVSDEMVDRYLEDIRKRYTTEEPIAESDFNDRLKGTFVELENGKIKENGITKEASFVINTIKDEKFRIEFLGRGTDSTIDFNPMKAFEDATAVAEMLGITKEEAEALTSDFTFTIKEVLLVSEPELNEEFFTKLYPGEEIKTIEDFRERIRKDAATSFVQESDKLFMDKVVKTLIEKANLELPDAFLKRWIVDSNEGKVSVEQVEDEYANYATSVKWQLIENKIIIDNDIRVTEEDIRDHYRAMFRFSEEMDDEMKKRIDTILESFMKNKEEVRKINDQLHDKKLLDLFKTVITLNAKEVSYEDFIKLATENN